MAQTLTEYLDGKACKGFTAQPHYFRSGDFVSYYFRNDPCYAKRVDDLLTVYLANDSDEMVGCKIKGVKHILDTAGEFGVLVDGGTLKLGLLFFYGAARAKSDEQKKRYEEISRIAKDASLPRDELCLSAI